MSDNSALRSRRYRAHKRGDHALCGPRCHPVTGIVDAWDSAVTLPGPGVTYWLAGQLPADLAEGSPKADLAEVAAAWAAAIEVSLAEFRGVLIDLGEFPEDKAGDRVAELKAARARRRAAALIPAVS